MAANVLLINDPRTTSEPYKFTLSVKTECSCYVFLQLRNSKLEKIATIFSKVHPQSFELKVTVPKEIVIIDACIDKQFVNLFAPYLNNPKLELLADRTLKTTNKVFQIHETEELTYPKV